MSPRYVEADVYPWPCNGDLRPENTAMKSKNESKFDRAELVLWLLFLVMVGCVWLVVTDRLSSNAVSLS